MSKLDQILEDCVQSIEHGDTIEAVVLRYPKFANELRPILEAAVGVKNKGLFEVPSVVVRRNRAKLLHHAAQMRESRVKRSFWGVWFVPLRRTFVTLVILTFVFASGTNLVRASSSTLPGDQLYPIKRTWEDVLVFVTVDTQKREVLELEQENNRLGEVQQLFEKRRSAPVDFSGLVATQNVDQWSVSGVNVVITSHTKLPENAILVGAGVHVKGHAQNGSVEAESIELISLNEVNTVSVVAPGTDQTVPNPDDQKSAPDTGMPESVPPEAPVVVVNPVEQQSNSFKGIIQSRVGNVWVINGVQVDVSNAEVSGALANGVIAKAEGYFNQNGIFIATQIELSGNNSSGNNNNNGGNNNNNDGNNNTYGGNNNNNDGNNNNNDSNNNTYGGNNNNNDGNNNTYGGNNKYGGNDRHNNHHGEREGSHDHPHETPEPSESEH